jgi:hypothetical protein
LDCQRNVFDLAQCLEVGLKGEIVMAVHTKTGTYTIPALKIQDFTFWWGSNYLPASYFNVSIEPNAEGLDLIPLVEEGRQITTIAPKGDVRQPQLILTLRNNNTFDVPFFANHILVTT